LDLQLILCLEAGFCKRGGFAGAHEGYFGVPGRGNRAFIGTAESNRILSSLQRGAGAEAGSLCGVSSPSPESKDVAGTRDASERGKGASDQDALN